MPTTIEHDIGGGLNDYATVNLWESNEASDMVADDEEKIGHLYNFVQTSKLTILGFTSDATHKYFLNAVDNHNGVYSSSVFRWEFAGKDALKVNDATSHFEINGGQFKLTGGTSVADFIKNTSTAGTGLWNKCIFENDTTGAGGGGKSPVGLQSKEAGPLDTIRSCLFIDWVDSIDSVSTCVQGKNFDVENCTSVNSDQGYHTKDALSRVRNSVADGCTDGFVGTTWATGSDYNASDIAADAPGGNSQNGTATAFEDAGSDDYHLSSSDTVCLDNGLDNSGDYTEDIDGDTFSRWSIGMDDGPAVAGAAALLRHPMAPFRHNLLR